MTKQILLIGLLTGLLINLFCNQGTSDTPLQVKSNRQDMNVTKETLKQILNAFNQHDLDAIMEFFSDDCSFDFPRGPESWGQRFIGKAQVREALAGRFKGIPNVHYGECKIIKRNSA